MQRRHTVRERVRTPTPARLRSHTLPSSFTPPNPSTTSTLPSELSQIQTYVNLTNTHISHLLPLLDPSASAQLAEIKRGLRDAHRGLEKLETRFAAVAEITREVWQTYRRLRDLEDKLRAGEEENISSEEWEREREEEREIGVVEEVGTATPRVVRAVPAVQTESVVGDEDLAGALPVVREEEREEVDEGVGVGVGEGDGGPGVLGDVEDEEEERFQTPDVITPELPSIQDLVDEELPDTVVISRRKTTHLSSRNEDRGNEPQVPARRSSTPLPHLWTGGRRSKTPHDVEDNSSMKLDPRVKSSMGRVLFPEKLRKTRREVLDSIAQEEAESRIGIIDPDRRRQGSADGWLISQAIMTASEDPRVCVPHLAYLKIHEVRDLKKWLRNHKYLRRSRHISRTEKLLHMLTILQLGCRYETVAVLFSRSPKEVLFACREVFEGLLELHSETMLPGRKLTEKYLYPHLWHIVDRYQLLDEDAPEPAYHPWEKEDICQVLITLNICIGRYRSQGHLALDGEILDWGKYIHVEPKESALVVHWIEKLQTQRPEDVTGQENYIEEVEEPTAPQSAPQQVVPLGRAHTTGGSGTRRRGGLMASTIRMIRGSQSPDR